MPGIYIHIPYCKKACHYCDFYFSTSKNSKEDLLEALKKEIATEKDYLENKEITTIYFGGGTPSLLSQKEILELFEELNKYHEISNDAEITLEANPDDLTIEKLKELKDTPVNRLSIGIQSFRDEDLQFLNRGHSSHQALESVINAQNIGFKNINIDLIYGIQNLSDEQWKENLKNAFALNVQHISSYCLTVEPKTVLSNFIKKGKIKNIDESSGAKHFEIMVEMMRQNDFVHYEISNFCKEGFYSKHNSSYWLKDIYLGLGPSAHSYNRKSRKWNVSNNALYIKSFNEDKIVYEKEVLTPDQQHNEYVLTSIRTMWGANLDHIKETFGERCFDHCISKSEPYIKSNCLINQNNTLLLTDKGKLISDKITADLFI